MRIFVSTSNLKGKNPTNINDLKLLVEEKLEKLTHFNDKIITVNVVFTCEKRSKKVTFISTITTSLPGRVRLRAKGTSELSAQAAFATAYTSMVNEVKKKKEIAV